MTKINEKNKKINKNYFETIFQKVYLADLISISTYVFALSMCGKPQGMVKWIFFQGSYKLLIKSTLTMINVKQLKYLSFEQKTGISVTGKF